MVILPRNENSRMRALAVLAALMGATLLAGAIGGVIAPIGGRLLLGLVALAGVALAVVLLVSMRGPSKMVLFHQGEWTILATNHLHQANRLRFFRDVLGEHSFAFSDEDRERWSALTREGFHPVFNVHGLRKTYLLSLCFMTFDEVYVFDHLGRWDFFDCRNTSEPTYSSRGISPFRDDSVVPIQGSQPATQ
jgi:hypothetical protein